MRRHLRIKKADPRRFTRKAKTAKKRRQWKHVYKSERERGISKPRAIRAANSVIKRETLKKNPAQVFNIEACVVKRGIPEFMYWDDTGQRFTSNKPQASPYKSRKAAVIEAKKLMPRLPREVATLRVLPA